jgi:hypothetical protein
MKLLEIFSIVLLTLIINDCLNQIVQADGVYRKCSIQSGYITTCGSPFTGEAAIKK